MSPLRAVSAATGVDAEQAQGLSGAGWQRGGDGVSSVAAGTPPGSPAAGSSEPESGLEPRRGLRAAAVVSVAIPPESARRVGSGEASGPERPLGVPVQAASHGPAKTLTPPWRLMALPVCASTEIELDRWLQRLLPDAQQPLPGPMAVIARRQRFGRGQQGRQWSSPAGGVWLSAALPWPADPAAAAAPGLAVAVGLALQLEALGLAVLLKWPNDLLIAGPGGQAAKLAGLLPRLRLQGGRIRWARVGIGLNGSNRVPAGATNLRGALAAGQLRPERLAARVLLALDWAMAVADQPTWVRQQAEARLLVAPGSWQGAAEGWQPHGLADDGALLLARGAERRRVERRFKPE